MSARSVQEELRTNNIDTVSTESGHENEVLERGLGRRENELTCRIDVGMMRYTDTFMFLCFICIVYIRLAYISHGLIFYCGVHLQPRRYRLFVTCTLGHGTNPGAIVEKSATAGQSRNTNRLLLEVVPCMEMGVEIIGNALNVVALHYPFAVNLCILTPSYKGYLVSAPRMTTRYV